MPLIELMFYYKLFFFYIPDLLIITDDFKDIASIMLNHNR